MEISIEESVSAIQETNGSAAITFNAGRIPDNVTVESLLLLSRASPSSPLTESPEVDTDACDAITVKEIHTWLLSTQDELQGGKWRTEDVVRMMRLHFDNRRMFRQRWSTALHCSKIVVESTKRRGEKEHFVRAKQSRVCNTGNRKCPCIQGDSTYPLQPLRFK